MMQAKQDAIDIGDAVVCGAVLLALTAAIVWFTARPRHEVVLYALVDVSDSQDEADRQRSLAVVEAAVDQLQPSRVVVLGICDVVLPLYEGPVLDPADLYQAIEHRVSARQRRYGTLLKPGLDWVEQDLQLRSQPAVLLLSSDGAFDDLAAARSTAAGLADHAQLLGCWVANVRGQIVGGQDLRAALQTGLNVFGQRLLISSSPAEAQACLTRLASCAAAERSR